MLSRKTVSKAHAKCNTVHLNSSSLARNTQVSKTSQDAQGCLRPMAGCLTEQIAKGQIVMDICCQPPDVHSPSSSLVTPLNFPWGNHPAYCIWRDVWLATLTWIPRADLMSVHSKTGSWAGLWVCELTQILPINSLSFKFESASFIGKEL